MKRFISIVLAALMLSICFSVITVSSNIIKTTLSGSTLYVDDDGTADYISIQDAVDVASDGDTVFVYKGDYNEKVSIKKSIDLVGEDKQTTIIERGIDILSPASNLELTGFKIKNKLYTCQITNVVISDNIIGYFSIDDIRAVHIRQSSNVEFKDNTITDISCNNTCAGVKLDVSTNCLIENNEILNLQGKSSNCFGIFDASGSIDAHNTIKGNTISNLDGDFSADAIVPDEFDVVKENTIININCNDFATGLCVISDNVEISNNVIKDISGGSTSRGIELRASDCIVKENAIELVDSSGNVNGICITMSVRNTIINNTIIISKGNGIRIDLCSFLEIHNNEIKKINNKDGNCIGIEKSENITISNNEINGFNIGVYVCDSNHNVINENKIKNNYEYGIFLYESEGMDMTYFYENSLLGTTFNEIKRNRFTGNGDNAFFSFTYILRDGEHFNPLSTPPSFNNEKTESNIFYNNYWGKPMNNPAKVSGTLTVHRFGGGTIIKIGENSLETDDPEPQIKSKTKMFCPIFDNIFSKHFDNFHNFIFFFLLKFIK